MGCRAGYRFILVAVVLLCASGFAAAISPTAAHVVWVIVLGVGAGGGLGWLVAAVAPLPEGDLTTRLGRAGGSAWYGEHGLSSRGARSPGRPADLAAAAGRAC
jgi:hypothetical protein